MPDLKIGDRVMYTRQWLRACGFVTGPLPFRRGVVAGIMPGRAGAPRVIEVDWSDGDRRTGRVIETNLVRADRLHLESP